MTPDYESVFRDARLELEKATSAWPRFNSGHEGYGIIAEELRELEEIVFQKQKDRDLDKLRREAIQLAAMAIRFAAEVCNENVGRR